MSYTILRIAKLKTWGAIAGCGKHNRRMRETPNADESRTGENRILLGNSEHNEVEALKAALQGQKIRANAVLGVEMLISASPEYFRPFSPENAGEYDGYRLHNWVGATTDWLQEKYGNRILSAVLHLDEATPHIHVLLVPLDDKGKLNCRALFGGSRKTLSELQTSYAHAVAQFGIRRGIENSRAKHKKVRQYYTRTQATSEQALPWPQSYIAPDIPSKLMRMSDSVIQEYARQVALNSSAAQREEIAPIVSALQTEIEHLHEEAKTLKQSNSRLSRENEMMRPQLAMLRSLDLAKVAKRMFLARGPYPTEQPDRFRFYLPDKRELILSNTSWEIPGKKRGKGAIDLVMALRGYGQEKLNQAIGELARNVGVNQVIGECLAPRLEELKTSVVSAFQACSKEEEIERKQELLRYAEREKQEKIAHPKQTQQPKRYLGR